MKLSLTSRIVLTVLCFGAAIIGFMMKLPVVFRAHDTELHTLFYFLAAGFLNVLFVKRRLIGHVLVFVLLYAMGAGIEYAQEYSNSLVGQRIHGRYDPEDIEANVKGLVYFSVLWVGYVIVWHATRSVQSRAPVTPKHSSEAAVVGPTVAGVSRQSEPNGRSLADPGDIAKLREVIRLLGEVTNHNPAHPLASRLGATIRELNQMLEQ
ncbi:MAG: hypothetical protein EOO09_12880 [Chitinophagaceae bacterium]|nr:MAG: hypothetical protein EOO09_12880 [Chitinophagaceae bacterium]